MPAIITNKFRIHNAEQFLESFTEAAPNVYYLGIGKPQPFTTNTRPDGRTDNGGSDSIPITPADSVAEEFYSFDDLLAVKKILSSNVSTVIPRRNWTSGTVYDYYRHDYGNRITGTTTTQTSDSGATSLFDSTFYVITEDFNVYKCLDNNNGASSQYKPTGTSNNILTTADDYKWKYMYTLSATQQQNFLSTDFMAVSTNGTVSGAAVNGAINIVKIKTAGSGGSDGTYSSIPIRGDGSSGQVEVVISSGAINSVSVTTPGTNYTYAYITLADIAAAGGSGLSGAELDCIIEPKGGHGSNAIKELGGFFIMMNLNFEGTESANSGDFTTANDFRKVLLMRDPQSGGSAASASTLRGTKAVVFASSPAPGTFQIDEEINQATTGAVGKVVEWDATNRILYYIQTRFNDEGVDANGNLTAFSTTAVITGQSSSATGTPDTTVTSTVNNVSFIGGYSQAEIDSDTGDIIYIENRVPITRADDQTENIKLIVEF